MRNLIRALLFLFVIQNLSAQTGQGDFLVGSNVSVHYSTTNYAPRQISTTTFSWLINPKVGFFMIDNLCLGASIPISLETATYSTSNDVYDYSRIEAYSNGIGPFLRYYFPIKKIQIITEISYSWNNVKTESTSYDQLPWIVETKTKSKLFTAASGVGILLSDHIALELLLNYQDTVYDTRDPSGWGNEFDQKHFLLSAGIQFYLHKKPS
jgi:hypothetical protein